MSTVTEASMAERVTPAGWAARLQAAGFAVLPHAELLHLVPDAGEPGFRALWDALEPDETVLGGGRYRRRRYGMVRVVAVDGEFHVTALPHVPFRQDAAHIPAYGGRPRVFSPIPDEVLLSPAITGLVAVDLSVVMGLEPATNWLVGLHMIRIVSEPGMPGEPTPEGRHRDGHDFIGMHLIDRGACTGGVSVVYPSDCAPTELTLTESLDSIVLKDDALTHEVSPIVADGSIGYRDTLLVDLNVDYARA
jgi:hypothetical protein